MKTIKGQKPYKKITIEYYPLNKWQQETLERIKKLTKSAHYIDLKIRNNGKDVIEQADFLRGILQQIK